jgi:hypothetical protein
MTRRRSPAKTVRVAERAKQFRNQRVTECDLCDGVGWNGEGRVKSGKRHYGLSRALRSRFV